MKGQFLLLIMCVGYVKLGCMAQNIYGDKSEYFNMDTVGSVTRGRWDYHPVVLQSFRERKWMRNDVIDSLNKLCTPANTDPPYKTVFRETLTMPEIAITNKGVRATLRKAIRIFKKKKILLCPNKPSFDDWDATVVVPDTSGFFVDIQLQYLYDEHQYQALIRFVPNYYLYNYTIYAFYRNRKTINDKMDDYFWGCFYYDDLLCIVSSYDSVCSANKHVFYKQLDSNVNIHLYQEEIQVFGLRYLPYIGKVRNPSY